MRPLFWRIAGAMLSRLVINTVRRFVYPFAPVIGRELEVSLTAVTGMVAACQVAPLVGLVSGPLADRWGYRRMMICGLALVALGMWSAGIWATFPVLTIAVVLASFGKTIFDPALQAYVGARVDFAHRGLVIGLLEFPWAGSTLIGIPLIGLLMQEVGWSTALFSLGAAALVCIAIVVSVFEPDKSTAPEAGRHIGLSWRPLWARPAARGLLGFAFFASAANDALFIVYGVWLESRFGMGLAALGLSTVTIGAAELFGEAMMAFTADRMGLKRSATIGLFLSMAAYATLPLWGAGLTGALAGLFLVFVAFEFTIVNCLSLATELVPGRRATMMSGFYIVAGFGRVCGALIGVPLWQAGGIAAVGASATGLTLLALVSLLWGLAGWRR
jgi:predicted MFS family arabinose efflux permease